MDDRPPRRALGALSRLERALRDPRARVAGAVLGLALLGLLLLRLADLWGDRPPDLDDADWPLLALALAATGVAMTCLALIWGPCLRAVGAEPPRGLAAAYYLGQLAKYLPGGGWQYLGRAALAARLGVPLRAAGASLALETAAIVAGAALVTPLLLADDALGAAVAVVILHTVAVGAIAAARWPRVVGVLRAGLARAAGPGATVRPGEAARAVGLFAGAWLIFGLALWLTARALFAAPAAELLPMAGAFAIAWIAGFVAVIAPGGIGVREAVLVGLLGPRIGAAEAILLAAASRIAFTLVDLGGALAAVVAMRRLAPPAPNGATPAG
ncbi:MAG: glycosyltransferase 2 family protein [Miltoncostaeaceae bacterium]|nr:glycosyltransferase 2 family protein [Miltoncostaeaceae bacterium]